jgi:hypothetical protein
MIASVLIQLRKPPERRSYPEGFLQHIHQYLANLAPVVETELNNHTLKTKLSETQQMVHEIFKSGDKRQSKITDFLSVTEKIVEQANKVASSVSSRRINRQMKRRGLTRDEDLDTDVETDGGLETDDDEPDGNLWEGDDLIDNEQDEE